MLIGLSLGFDTTTMASPDVLWPPNHTLRPVTVTSTSNDTDLDVLITEATSSEADSGLGDDDVPNDIVITGSSTVDLRAEPFSTSGRTYTITALVSGRGQSKLDTVFVVVPHNMGLGLGPM